MVTIISFRLQSSVSGYDHQFLVMIISFRLRSSVSGYDHQFQVTIISFRLSIHGNRLPVTRYQFGAILNKAISYACLSNKYFKNHSLRIGRATELAMASVPSDQVITMGRWQSGCCTKYIRP